MRYDPDAIARWNRRRWFTSFITGLGLFVQSVGFEFVGSGVPVPLRALFTAVTLVAALLACYYWYRLARLPVSA